METNELMLSSLNRLCLSVISIAHNGSRFGEVAEHKTSLELQNFKIKNK